MDTSTWGNSHFPKKYRILISILGWLSMPVVIFLLIYDLSPDVLSKSRPIWYVISVWLGFMLLYYLNRYVLLPLFFFKGKRFLYSVLMFLILVLVNIIRPFDYLLERFRRHDQTQIGLFRQEQMDSLKRLGFPVPPHLEGDIDTAMLKKMRPPMNGMRPVRPLRRIDLIGTLVFTIIIGTGFVSELIKRLNNSYQQVLKSDAERSKAELAFLRAQINPHFLFNTLNNIYAMSVVGNPATPEAIIKLSNILRYVTDNADELKIPLEDDLQCIGDYIYLNQLRLGKSAHLEYVVTGNPKGKMIVPMLFMSFVENIFKHGISKAETSPVVIHIDITEHNVTFYAKNKIFENQNTKLERNGLGNINSKKRLDLLYPNQYKLNINQENGWFEVTLVLNYLKK